MINLLRALQVVFLFAWLIPIVLFRRQAWSKANAPCDQLAAATWYAAMSIVAFPLRWLLQGGIVQHMSRDELAVWSALYVLGTFAAVYLTLSVSRVCRTGA